MTPFTSRKELLKHSVRLGRLYFTPQKMHVPTSDLYLKSQELQSLLAIADKAAQQFQIPSEVSDEERLRAADIARTLNRYRKDLGDRLAFLNIEISKRLESL